jgi:hypothetical protein
MTDTLFGIASSTLGGLAGTGKRGSEVNDCLARLVKTHAAMEKRFSCAKKT